MKHISLVVLAALLLAPMGCETEEIPVYPTVGKWEGPGIIYDGWGLLRVPNTPDAVYTYRAPLVWPDGVARDHAFHFTGGGDGAAGAITIEDDAIVARLSLGGQAKLPFSTKICAIERCATFNEYESFDLGWGIQLVPGGATAEGILMPSQPADLAVGERRGYQGYPWARTAPFLQLLSGVNSPRDPDANTTAKALEDAEYAMADPTIATVDARGFITGVSVGTTTLNVSAGSVETNVTVTVNDAEMVASPRGIFPMGGDGKRYFNTPTHAEFDGDDRPHFLIGSRGTYALNPAFPVSPYLGNNAYAIMKWTGTGFGWEWVTQNFFEPLQDAHYWVDDAGREYIPHFDSFRGFRASVWTRANDTESWTKHPLPVRPDLNRGQEYAPDLPAGLPGGLEMDLMGLTETAAGIEIRYRIALQLQSFGDEQSEAWKDYNARTWDVDTTGGPCFGLERVALISPTGALVSVETTQRLTEIPTLDCSLAKVGWQEDPIPGPPSYDAGFRVVDPYGALVEAGTDHPTIAVAEAFSATGVHASLWTGPGEFEAVLVDATYLRHEDPDALGRRIGLSNLTPRSQHRTFAHEGCRLVVDQKAPNASYRAKTHIAEGPDSVWVASDIAIPNLKPESGNETLFSRADGLYTINAGAPVGMSSVAVYRSTDCKTFELVATEAEFASSPRQTLFRDDGSLWVFGPDLAPGGGILRFADPAPADPDALETGVTTLSTLEERFTQGYGTNYAIHDLGDRVVTLIQRDDTIAVSEWDSDGQPISSIWAELTEPGRFVYALSDAVPFANGSWIVHRRGNGFAPSPSLVRTSDFETFETVLNGVDCWKYGSPCLGLKLSDGRGIFTDIDTVGRPNREASVLHVFDADGTYEGMVEVRADGGNRQGIWMLHEEVDGSISVLMHDNVSFLFPQAGQPHRWETLVQRVDMPATF